MIRRALGGWLARLLHLFDGPLTDRWPDLVYAVRPYDQLADARRWRWQQPHPCQYRVGADEWLRWGFRLEPGGRMVPLHVVWPTSPDWPDAVDLRFGDLAAPETFDDPYRYPDGST